MILFGHQTGNPNAHHAALAHYEAGRLHAFVVPWFPSRFAVSFLRSLPFARQMADRLARRRFEALAGAPKIQGRLGEFRRLAIRAFGKGDEGLSYEVNDWLMRRMARECHSPAVTAVHSYEDASLGPFQEAKKLGKACIYDMPIGYYPAWEQTQAKLAHDFSGWLPATGLSSSKYVRPRQKRDEMDLADVVLVPSSFVEKTIRDHFPDKKIARAPYGVDLDFWHPTDAYQVNSPMRFIYAGQMSLRKGIPILLDAWGKAGLADAHLDLVGTWQLAQDARARLPRGVTLWPQCSSEVLRERYQAADVFVFPSFFEGFGLVLLEAMACGLPAIGSDATAAPDVLNPSCGQVVKAGDVEELIAALQWFDRNRAALPDLRRAARGQAEKCTWDNYRHCVSAAVAGYS